MNSAVVELYVDGAWTDITSDVYTRNPISVGRGKGDESGQTAPSRCSLTLNNRAGTYSPRNPLSPYYGKIGRNTPIRVIGDDGDSVQTAVVTDAFGRVNASSWGNADSGQTWQNLNFLTTTLSVGSGVGTRSITGAGGYSLAFISATLPHVDVKVDFSSTIVAVSGGNLEPANLMVRYTTSSNYYFTRVAVTPTQAVTIALHRFVAGVETVIAPSVTVVGLTYAASTPIRVRMRAFGSEIRAKAWLASGPEPSAWQVAATDTSLTTGGTGIRTGIDVSNSNSSPKIFNYDNYSASPVIGQARFYGEVSSFPPRWDESTNDAYVSIECAGLLRRLNQGVDSPASGLRAAILAGTGLYNYWPLEGGAGTKYSLDIGGTNFGKSQFYAWPSTPPSGPTFTYGAEYGTYLSTGLALTTSGSGYLRGDIGTNNNYVAIDLVFQSTSLGSLTYEVRDYSDFLWSVNLDGGVAQVSFTDPALGPIGFSPTGALPELTDGLVHHLRLDIVKSGANTNWTLYLDGVSVDTGSQSSYNLNGASMVRVYYSITGTETAVNLGHVAVWSNSTGVGFPTAADLTLAMNGYIGETAGARIERLATAAGYAITTTGAVGDTAAMGPLYSEGFLTQLRDAESTDLGVLAEPRDVFGLSYRTRASLYNQSPKATIDYSAEQLSPPFEPVDDDQLTRNDVTVTKRDAGSYQATVDSGPLSTQEPPNGVGRYQDSVTVNVESEAQLPDVASWLVSAGTLDEARFPTVTVNLNAPETVAIAPDLLSVDLGDLITVTNASALGIYDDVSLIVLGYVETIEPAEHTITFNCAPASPYTVAVYGSAAGSGPDRYDTGGSSLSGAHNSLVTSLSVATATGHALWTTTSAEFPFDIFVGGERMTVTNISGASSPQTFTVTRHVNGVTKSHATGAAVRLWRTPRYAF